MIYAQIQAHAGFMWGLVTMVSLHNTVVSYLLYRTRQTNISNLIKIIFNFGNFIRFFALWGTYMTPAVATMLHCASLQYIQAVGNVIVRVSVTAFLLYRLRQVHNSKLDNWVSIVLFIIRTGFGVVQLGFQRPTTLYLADEQLVICDAAEITSRLYMLAAFLVEFVVDVFVTLRLVQVLRKANKNAASISSNITRKSRRTLFTAVMYWNFLRLFVAVIFHMVPLLNMFLVRYAYFDSIDTLTVTLLSIINIVLSYVITVDAEIVRVIEGKNDKKGSSAGTEKSFSGSQSPRSPRTRYGGRSSSDLPKYSQSTSSGQDTYSQIDDDKVAVVSMKRLSFFEWANFVVGKRLRRNDEEQYEEENTEEIIDEPSKADKEDLEKGFPQDRRSSSFSGTTSVSTLDENPDIVTS